MEFEGIKRMKRRRNFIRGERREGGWGRDFEGICGYVDREGESMRELLIIFFTQKTWKLIGRFYDGEGKKCGRCE